jgi:hypothetical protein
MPQILRMPSTDALPPGPRRVFVAELHVHFREAARRPPSDIAAATRRLTNPLPVSRETIRRLLVGQTLSTWARVDSVLRALCQLAGQDPDRRRWPEPEDRFDENDPSTCREYLRRLWNDAIDGSEPNEAPAVPPQQPASGWGGTPTAAPHSADDPWAVSSPKASGWGASQPTSPSAGGYPDEPPF